MDAALKRCVRCHWKLPRKLTAIVEMPIGGPTDYAVIIAFKCPSCGVDISSRMDCTSRTPTVASILDGKGGSS